jgi:hypothetical protein
MYERHEQSERMRHEMQSERLHSEQFARQLRSEVANQWRKALMGLFALPTGAALGLAATVAQTAAFLERVIEIFQRSAESVRRNMDGERRDRADAPLDMQPRA